MNGKGGEQGKGVRRRQKRSKDEGMRGEDAGAEQRKENWYFQTKLCSMCK
jgi:hypothetical protein